MDQLFGSIIMQFREFWKTLTPTKQVSLVGSAAVVLVATALLFYLLSGSEYVPLFKNVDPSKVGIIVDQLKQKNVPFRMEDGGATIIVPREVLYATQMALMSEIGNTQMGSKGLEIFDNQDFGITNYAQRVNYQRALQGELMRAINSLEAVKRSKVILALPAKKTFLEKSGKPSASIVIELTPGKMLEKEQIKSIRFLVSSSVENLEPEEVTVVDNRGKVLSKHYDSSTAATSDIMDLQRRVETDLESRIEEMLSKFVGRGKVIAKVDATLSVQQKSMVEEKVDGDSSAIRSIQTEEEKLNGARTNPAGVPGARANLPGAEDGGQVGFNQNQDREMKTTNYEVPKTITNVKEAAGGLERLSVAVVVDGVMGAGSGEAEGAQVWKPRSADELKRFEEIVKSAVGYNAQRGDTVKIENFRFEKEDFTEAEELITTLERKKLIYAIFKWSLLLISLALIFFLIVRPFVRWITDNFQDSVDDMLPRTIEELEELQTYDSTLPGMSGALPSLEESLDPDKAESELLKDRILTLMEKSESKAAGAFGLWLVRRE